VTIYIQPCVLRRGRAQRDETQSRTEERECCAREGGRVDPGFFLFSFFYGGGGVGVSWMRNGKSGRLVDVCNSVFEVLVTLR
jgi:hypothetical protein